MARVFRRRIISILAAWLAFGTAVPAGDARRPVQAETRLNPYVYKPEWYAWARLDTVRNGFRTHAVTSLRWHATPEQDPKTEIRYGGQTGFTGLSPFLSLTVNAIPLHKILLDEGHFAAWEQGGRRGFEVRLNFDGAALRLRFYMRPDSPVLWAVLLPEPSGLEPIRSCELVFTALPSKLVKGQDGKVRWSGKDVYGRSFQTTTRHITPEQRATVLTAEETLIVFQDDIHDGAGPDRGDGPCLLVLNHAGVAQATAEPGVTWLARVRVALTPGFQGFHFGLLNHPVPIANQDFLRQLEDNRPAYTWSSPEE
jgi:hypothetical protein